jgi:hypothetical protein
MLGSSSAKEALGLLTKHCRAVDLRVEKNKVGQKLEQIAQL